MQQLMTLLYPTSIWPEVRVCMDGDQTKQKKCAYVFDEEIIQKKNKLNREFINIFYVFVHNFSIFFSCYI